MNFAGVSLRASPAPVLIMVIIFLMRNSQAAGRWCSEAEVRQIVGTDGAATLIEIISGAWQAYLDEGRVRRRRTRAGIVWEAMIERADRDLLTSFDGVRKVELPDSAGYVLCDRILMRFKKHDRKMRTTNVGTTVQRVLARQGYFDGMPDLAHVTCGYALDKAEAGIEKWIITRPVRRKTEWVIDLRELAAGTLAPVQPMLPGIDPAEQVAPLPSIRRRAEAEEGGDEE
jgi:hypothetical protein